MEIDLWKIFLESLPTALMEAWPFELFIAAVLIYDLIMMVRHRRLLERAGMQEIDTMTGDQFEDKLALLYRSLGYIVHPRGSHHGDYGVDLVIEKNENRTGVQAKRYTGHVGVLAIQQISTALKHANCTHGIVITNSHFTPQAKHLAAINGITLYDREGLARLMLTV